eukprot:TRINITY_DN94471_c0_g1_i1.p1 TRINITY_DN94471_c0_g1~~TRINITY_DN94471_c0_g1_i1.p1  ORF type:complete len:355 (-),score=50.16 TRINITY_DN94471_c0_g1_i1:34-1032(-)
MNLHSVSAQFSIAITGLLIPCWVALLLQERGWATKVSAWYTVEAGLLHVHFKKGTVVHLISNSASNSLFQKFNELVSVYTVEDFKIVMCGLASWPGMSNACYVTQTLWGASMGVFAAVLLGIVCFLTGSCLLAMWAFRRPRRYFRIWSRIFYIIGSIMFAGSAFGYSHAAEKLKELPPSTDAINSGPCVMVAALLSVLSCTPFLVSVCIGKSREESLNEALSLKHKEQREEMRFNANYGSAQSSLAPVAEQGDFEEAGAWTHGWDGYGYEARGYEQRWDPNWQGIADPASGSSPVPLYDKDPKVAQRPSIASGQPPLPAAQSVGQPVSGSVP